MLNCSLRQPISMPSRTPRDNPIYCEPTELHVLHIPDSDGNRTIINFCPPPRQLHIPEKTVSGEGGIDIATPSFSLALKTIPISYFHTRLASRSVTPAPPPSEVCDCCREGGKRWAAKSCCSWRRLRPANTADAPYRGKHRNPITCKSRTQVIIVMVSTTGK